MITASEGETEATGGQLHLGIERVAGESTVVRGIATSPLKLLTPRARGASVWAYLSSYGGGMVAGDRHRLDLRIGPGATAFFGTQSSTKIYRNPSGAPCSQQVRVTVGEGGFLAWIPDPVQPFAGATYHQRQEFHLSAGANLVFLDSFSAGRSERGEHWAFTEYRSRSEFWIDGRRCLLDSVCLRSDTETLPVERRMGTCQAMAFVVLLGPELAAASGALLASVSATAVGRSDHPWISASPLDQGALFRIAGTRIEAVRERLAQLLSFLSHWLGDPPFARKW